MIYIWIHKKVELNYKLNAEYQLKMQKLQSLASC
jgi:hypothetical protein